MTMSTDRVKFFLAPRYFNGANNGMTETVCKRILRAAFDMSRHESGSLMAAFPEGFWIVARPSQFARFIVRRHQWGDCINGIRDLDPKLIDGYVQSDFYQEVADRLDVSRKTVKSVALALNYDERGCVRPSHMANRVDVSKRSHQEGVG